MEKIETTGETVEEAIEAGLKELGVGPTEVMVEVIEEPSRGLLGIGAKPAVVRLILLGRRPPQSEPEVDETEVDNTPEAPNAVSPESEYDGGREDDDLAEPEESDHRVKVADEDADEDAQVGKIVLMEMLEVMEIDGNVTIFRAEATRHNESVHWVLNVTGKNMNRLIGRRGDTLNSLQYLTRLIVSRRLQRRANIIVDVAAYKSRRSDRLEQLAHRMADQSVDESRIITLEPMPPHERRIVHLALRSRKDVETRSVGEGNVRKVTIVPKR